MRDHPARHAGAVCWLITLVLLFSGTGLLGPWSESLARGQTQSSPSKAASEGGAESPAGDEVQESFLQWMIRASGPIGVLIVAMSFYLIALIVWMAVHYRASVAIPQRLVRDVQEMLDRRMYNEAYHRVIDDPSLLARVLAAGVRKLPSGLPLAQRAMEMANEDATMQMEHRTTYLATVGTLGPMIGLVGTVYGMILAFRVIATEGATPQASELAKGISTALFATLEGIAISIPAIYFYAMFRNRIARLSLETGIAAEPLLEQFAPGVRLMGGEPSPTAANAPSSPPRSTTSSPVHVPSATPKANPAAAHPHPFAVNAALAASKSAAPSSEQPALPPGD